MKAAVRWACRGLFAATLASGAWHELSAQSTGSKQKPIPGVDLTGLPESVRKSLPSAPPIPSGFDALFGERDARAMDALSYLRCMNVTLRAIQGGALGQVPRSWILTCVEQGAEWRGVFVEFTDDDPGVKIHRQFALRGGGAVVSDPVDTATVAGIARALVRGLAAPVPGKGQYQYLPVPLRQPTFIELWYLPVPSDPSRAVVGGDSLIQLSVDGTRELGHSRTTPPIRTFAVTPGASYVLASKEERIPLLSELMVAHMALSVAPDVRVRTTQFESIFSRSSTAVKHVRRSGS